METADVRKRVKDALERVKRQHAERRARNAQASAAFEVFLQRSAVPVFQQVAGALKAEGYLYVVNTPAGSVQLVSEKSGSDFIDLRLDTGSGRAQVAGDGRALVLRQRVLGDHQGEQVALGQRRRRDREARVRVAVAARRGVVLDRRAIAHPRERRHAGERRV